MLQTNNLVLTGFCDLSGKKELFYKVTAYKTLQRDIY